MGNDYKYNFIAAIVKIYYSLIKMFHSFLDHIDKTITDIYRKKKKHSTSMYEIIEHKIIIIIISTIK